MSVEDIKDIFDGAKSMDEILDSNIIKLQKQMEELKSAIKLSKKMKEDQVDISLMNTELYWNTIEEEEKYGNSFIDIAKDIAVVEKDVIKSYFSFSDCNGKNYDSLPTFIQNVIIAFSLTGCILCLMRGSWTLRVTSDGLQHRVSNKLLTGNVPALQAHRRYPQFNVSSKLLTSHQPAMQADDRSGWRLYKEPVQEIELVFLLLILN